MCRVLNIYYSMKMYYITFNHFIPPSGHSNWVMSGDVTDRNITTAGWDGNLGVWDPNQSKPITFLKGLLRQNHYRIFPCV